MIYEPKNTLSYFLALPQTQLHDMSHVNAQTVAINCKKYRENCGTVSPDASAVGFYVLNHLAAMVQAKFTKHEPLPEWAVEVMAAYSTALVEQGRRLMHYMILICTRESRHIGMNATFKAAHKKKYGEAIFEFTNSIHGAGSGGAASAFCTSAPDAPMGDYVDSLSTCFHKGSFGGGYGGKPWGMVADTLASFIHGKTSMEMMVDTAWTLSHNNGPIFNKGMMYSMYDTATIAKLLDVQRSGQVPELVMGNYISGTFTKAVKPLVKKVMDLYPNEFGTEVDWQKVEDLGALHKYTKEKNAQKKKTPPKPKMVQGKLVIGEFAVYPGQKAMIYLRNEKVGA
jgi:hypothetical protein